MKRKCAAVASFPNALDGKGLYRLFDFSRSLKRESTENEEQDTSLREALHSSTDFVKRTTVEDVKMSRNLPYFGKLQL